MVRLVRVSAVALALLLAVVNTATSQAPDPQVDEAGCTYEIVYTSCSKECGGGTQRQKKIIVDKPADVDECTPYEEVEVACNQQACAFEGAGPEVVVTEENLALVVTDDKDVMFMEHDGEGNRREITTLRKLLKRLDDAESELASVKANAESEIAALKQSVNDHKTRMEALEAWKPVVDQSVSDMTSDIGDLQQEQSDTASTLSEVSSQVDDNVEKLGELDGDVSSLQRTVGGHSAALSTLQGTVSSLQQSVGTAGAKADTSLDRLDDAESRLDKLGSYSFLFFSRRGDGSYRFIDAYGDTHEMLVDSSSEDLQRVGQDDRGFAYKLNGPASSGLPSFYLSLEGVVSLSCAVLGNEDDAIRHWHIRYATDGGNGVESVWGRGGVATLILGFQNIDCESNQSDEECSHPTHLSTNTNFEIFCVSGSPTKP